MIRKLTTALFLLVLAAGALAIGWHLLSPPLSAAALTAATSGAAWRDGAVTAALDLKVRQGVPSSPALDAGLRGLLYALTGDADPQVRAGCPDWLFLAEESASTPHGAANLLARVRLAAQLRAALARRGITLVSVPVPDKVEQAGARLCGLAVSSQARGRAAAWSAATDHALLQIDLRRGWPRPGYWRTDTHWDRGGAAFAAGRVSATVRAMLPPGTTAMRERVGSVPQRRIGDLARLAGIERNAPPFAPAGEYDQERVLEIARAGGLLDDVAVPPVLLAGSSYSLNSGFLDALQLALGREVSQQSRAGGGFSGALLELLAHPARLDGVSVLVWEWPLRTVYQPLTADERAALSSTATLPSAFAQPSLPQPML